MPIRPLNFLIISGVFIAALLPVAGRGQNTEVLPKEAPVKELGLPPRAAPSEYAAQAKVGDITIAAEFDGHFVAAPDGSPLTTEDYVVVEAAFFGPEGSKLNLAYENFSLIVNESKKPLPQQPYGFILRSLKDPEAEPPAKQKSKTSLGGGGGDTDSTPAPVKIPVETQRAWGQRVLKASMPVGDRSLPQAGLIYFAYRGKTQGIHTLELVYDGPAGKASINLQP